MITPFRAHAKYVALVSGAIGLMAGRVAISEVCLAKVASMPNSTLRDRLIEAGYYGNKTAYRYYFRTIRLSMFVSFIEAHSSLFAEGDSIEAFNHWMYSQRFRVRQNRLQK